MRKELTTFLTRAREAEEVALALQLSTPYGGKINISSITTIVSFDHRHGNLI
jgi:hypothetical protein